ncbi:hypothetical protein CC78DRAFT_550067 [Lojkania enalia]|uniref:DUF7580 domain-containing protein n=1 Tax=Lojkania enalia TaxID=147567 RepID=A0A9P4ND89_9PLEO|nr:hypothetical protein CC78DRAFT_550067 [Didymosphaeria enalia]
MASGVELAGLVLATIPLIISALEHYEDAVEPTIAFFQWKGQLSKAINELSVVYASYDQALRLLLQPIASREDVVAMMEDTRDELWTKGDVAEELRNHLGAAWKPCVMTIEEVSDSLLEISQHLNIAGAQLVNNKDLRELVQANPPISQALMPKKRFEFKDQVKFTMKRRKLKAQIERIELCLKRLSDFTERAEKLDDGPPKSRWKVKFSGPLTVIRENASKLHSTLLRNWCAHNSEHYAGLHLEQRLVRPRKRTNRLAQESVASSDCFALSLNEHGLKKAWLSAEFRIVDLPSPNSSRISFTVSTAPNTSPTPYLTPSTLPMIQEICSYLQKCQFPTIGFCVDESHQLRAYTGQIGLEKCLDQDVTLAKMLSKLPQRLANGDIYNLAITLTASIFQLIDTPWLTQTWTKKAIIFRNLKPKTTSNIDITRPILVQTFGSTKQSTLSPRKALLALAILLIEILSTQPIENIQTPSDLSPNLSVNDAPDDDSNHRTALRWLFQQESDGNITRGFSSAITSCLQAYINPRADFSDAEFCRSIEESVLRPLEEERLFLM